MSDDRRPRHNGPPHRVVLPFRLPGRADEEVFPSHQHDLRECAPRACALVDMLRGDELDVRAFLIQLTHAIADLELSVHFLEQQADHGH